MSISLVRKELESTLQKAEGYFASYAEDQAPSSLKSFADELNLARGTFKLLELSGPEVLSTEMLSLIGDGSLKIEAKIEVLGQAILGLSQYIHILLEREKDYPVLLVPVINKIRGAGGHKFISESQFFSVNLRPKLPSVEKATINLKPHLPRLRLIYQAGLLRVLRDSDPKLGFKLIDRSLILLEKGFRGTLAWSFWWTAKAALEAIIEEDYELTVSRRVLFGKLDQIMRLMIKEGLQVFTAQAANELQKELLYLIAISEVSEGSIQDIKICYQLKSQTSEANLKLERKLLAGPDIEAYDSLSTALKVEIKSVKDALDAAAKNALEPEGFIDVDNRLKAISGVLKVIQQIPLSEKVEQQRTRISDLKGNNEEARALALVELADALLQVELACDRFVKGEVSGSDAIIGAGHFAEAKIILFDEIQSGLSLTKRALSNYIEANDTLHLANIKPALDGVRGAWVFLDDPKAVSVIESATKFFVSKVLDSGGEPDEARLVILADALTSIEYYAETLSHSETAGKDILELAVKSMGQLGYKI